MARVTQAGLQRAPTQSRQATVTRSTVSNNAWGDASELTSLSHRESGLGRNFSQVPVSFASPFSQLGDRFEREAAQTAQQVATGDLQTAVLGIGLSHAPLSIQRAPAGEDTQPAASAAPEAAPAEASGASGAASSSAESPTAPKSPALITEDDQTEIEPNQMRKSDFLSQLKNTVSTILPKENTDSIDSQFEFYSKQTAKRVEEDVRNKVHGASQAASAKDYIDALADQARLAAANSPDLSEQKAAPAASSAAAPAAAEAPAGAAGGGPEGWASFLGKIAFKHYAGKHQAGAPGSNPAAHPQAVLSKLDPGHPLDSGIKTRMETAFGQDFSRVRVHTGEKAAALSSQFNARAFTIGRDVAFAASEYQPGTLYGDALLAHELAHVVQQGSTSLNTATKANESAYDALENDADHSAVGAVLSLWGGAKGALKEIGKNAGPRLRSGLRLSRCNGGGNKTPAPSVSFAEVNAPNTPSGIKRIPPRVNTDVAVKVSPASGSGPTPVTLAVEGGGGVSGNGSATVNGNASYSLSADETVKLNGTDQTDPGKAGNLKLVARQGTNKLAESNGFSVAAYPKEIGFRFNSILSPLLFGGKKFWGAKYDLTPTSDSGNTTDLDKTKISENVLVDSGTGFFAGMPVTQSDFLITTGSQADRHAAGKVDNATIMKAVMDLKGLNSKSVQNQFFRFSDQRSGVAEDRAAGPQVPTSGFKITITFSKAAPKYFINVKKEGFANNSVAAGTVDDPAVKDAEVKD